MHAFMVTHFALERQSNRNVSRGRSDNIKGFEALARHLRRNFENMKIDFVMRWLKYKGVAYMQIDQDYLSDAYGFKTILN